MTRPILFVDMDNVLVDFSSGIARLDDATRTQFQGRLDEVPGIFSLMDPVDGAVEAFTELAETYDTFILSTAPWLNPSAWADKVRWTHQHLRSITADGPAYKRLILSHRKDLLTGDYLIDDRPNNGAQKFRGRWLQFGSAEFPNWSALKTYLMDAAGTR